MKNTSILLSTVILFLLVMAGCTGSQRHLKSSPSQSDASKAILRDLTPNMRGLAENAPTERAGIVVVNNANDRQYIDDWRRALLLDKPSVLSPYPVIDH